MYDIVFKEKVCWQKKWEGSAQPGYLSDIGYTL